VGATDGQVGVVACDERWLVERDGELVATMPGDPIVDRRQFELLRSK
jgi:hypothetical protein